nr:transposase [Nonomuraea pusilla]
MPGSTISGTSTPPHCSWRGRPFTSSRCYSIGEDRLWGVTRLRKSGDHTSTALKSIRATRPDGAPIYVIADNWPGSQTRRIRSWASRHKAELCFTPTAASWANPIEPHFGPLRRFVLGNSDPANHPVLARELQAGSSTQRTSPHPQRTPATLRPTTIPSSLTTALGESSWSTH